MGRKILLSIFACANLFALDINEAINSAIENNYSLKQQQYIKEESKLNLDSSYVGYKPKLDLKYNYNNRDKTITSQIKEDSTFSAVVSYNLFSGFKDMYNIDASKDIYNYSALSFEAFKEDLKLEVKTKYIKYLLAQKNQETSTQALKLYEKQYKDSQNFYTQGLIAKNELLEVEVQMLQATSNLQKSNTDLTIAKQELENIIGKNISDEVKAVDFKEVGLLDKNSCENRSELKALKFLVSSYKNSAKANKSGYMPRVDASFSVNKYGEDITPSQRTGYPDSQSIASLNLSWNLYNGNSDELNVLKQTKKQSQALMQYEDLKQKIQLQYKTALEQLNLSKLNLKTATKALEVAKLNYEIVNSKVKEGLSSNKDLIDANYLLTQSKQNYTSAYYNRYLSIANIQRVLEVKN